MFSLGYEGVYVRWDIISMSIATEGMSNHAFTQQFSK